MYLAQHQRSGGEGARKHCPGYWTIPLVLFLVGLVLLPGAHTAALPYGWDATWGEPLYLGSAVIGTTPPVVTATAHGTSVYWVDREDADSGASVLHSVYLHSDTDRLRVVGRTQTRVEGKVISLSAYAGGGVEFLAWTVYDGEEYRLTVTSVVPGGTGDLAVLATESFSHGIGRVSVAGDDGRVVVSWEDYRDGRSDVRAALLRLTPPLPEDPSPLELSMSIGTAVASETGDIPGPLTFPRVALSGGRARVVFFQKQYTRAGTIWIATLEDAGQDGISLERAIPLFAPGLENRDPYEVVSLPDTGHALLMFGELVGDDASPSAAGLLLLPLSGRDQPITLLEMSPRGRGETSAVIVPGSGGQGSSWWVAWTDTATGRSAQVTGTQSDTDEEWPYWTVKDTRSWTFGFQGACAPNLLVDPDGRVCLVFVQSKGMRGDILISREGDPAGVTRWNLVGVIEGDVVASALYRMMELSVLAAFQVLGNFPVLVLCALLACSVGSRLPQVDPFWIVLMAALMAIVLFMIGVQPVNLRAAGGVMDAADRLVHTLVAVCLLGLLHIRRPFAADFLAVLLAVVFFSWWHGLFSLMRVVYIS